MSRKAMVTVVTFLMVVVLFNFQNCSQVNFADTPPQVLTDENADIPLAGRYQRKETTEVNLKNLAADNDFKVFLIVDNSSSMENNQLKLKTGLSSIVNQLAGYNVKFYVYTTDSLIKKFDESVFTEGQKTGEVPIVDLSGSFSFPDGSSAEGAFGSVEGYSSYTTYLKVGRDLSETMGINLSLRHDENTPSKIAQLKANLDLIIRSIEDTGNKDESGICTLARLIGDAGISSAIQPGDLASFIILSDEDDKMSTDNSIARCSNKFVQRKYTSVSNQREVVCSANENCPMVRYRVRPKEAASIVALMVETAEGNYSNSFTSCTSLNLSGCGALGERMCSAMENQEALEKLAQQKNLPLASLKTVYCKVQTVNRQGRLKNLYSKSLADVSSPANIQSLKNELNKNWCNEGPFEGKSYFSNGSYKTYNNMKIFVEEQVQSSIEDFSCTKEWIKVERVERETSSIFGQVTLMSESTRFYSGSRYYVKELVEALDLKMKKLFGDRGFHFMPIIHDKAADQKANCTLDSSDLSAYGEFYKDVFEQFGAYGSVQSICQSEYVSGLSDLVTYVEQENLNNVSLKRFFDREIITGVTVTRRGQIIVLDPKDYTIVGKRVMFAENFLQDGDVVVLDIQNYETEPVN